MAEFFWRIGLAFKCFFLVLFAGHLPDDVPPDYLRGQAAESAAAAREPTRPVPAAPSAGPGVPAPAAPGRRPPDRAVQLLAVLQRDGRLVDFLMEDIGRLSRTRRSGRPCARSTPAAARRSSGT